MNQTKLHFFFSDLAEKYGHCEAIILNHFLYWIAHNSLKKKQNNFRDGRFWTFNPVREIANQFPYFSKSQVGRYIKSLISQDVIITGNFNRHLYDRTTWYALKDEAYFLAKYHPISKFKECKRMFEDDNTK